MYQELYMSQCYVLLVLGFSGTGVLPARPPPPLPPACAQHKTQSGACLGAQL